MPGDAEAMDAEWVRLMEGVAVRTRHIFETAVLEVLRKQGSLEGIRIEDEKLAGWAAWAEDAHRSGEIK